MDTKFLTFVIIVIVASAATTVAMKNTASAQLFATSMISDTNDTISVTGTATSKIQPDRVQVNFAIQTMNETAGNALRANSEATAKVITALKQMGIGENDTYNVYFSIYPNYNLPQFGSSNLAAGYTVTNSIMVDSSATSNTVKLTGYTVTNSIMVDSSATSNTSRLVDVAVAAGATRVDGIFFTISDGKTEKMRADLTQQAIVNAKSKANALADALGVKIIGIKAASLNDLSYLTNPTSPSPGTTTASSSVPQSMQTPIMAAGQKMTASVTIVYKVR